MGFRENKLHCRRIEKRYAKEEGYRKEGDTRKSKGPPPLASEWNPGDATMKSKPDKNKFSLSSLVTNFCLLLYMPHKSYLVTRPISESNKLDRYIT